MIAVVATRAQVVVADDDVLLREGLASLLHRLRASRSSGRPVTRRRCWTLVRSEKPDLVLVDIRMPPTHTTEGLDAARVIREEAPGHRHPGALGPRRRRARDGVARRRAAPSAICSRAASPTSTISSTRCDRVANGASVVDPALVAELVAARRRRRSAGRAERPGTRGAHADGRGSVERRDRPPDLGHRGHGREARPQHPDQAPIAETGDDHRRVRAVLAFLDHH